MVEIPEGGTYRRNRFHLRKTGEPRTPPNPDILVEAVETPDKEPTEAPQTRNPLHLMTYHLLRFQNRPRYVQGQSVRGDHHPI